MLRRLLELVARRRLRGESIGLLFQQTVRVGLVDFLALGCLDTVVTPLPQLAAADFGRRGVLLEATSVRARPASSVNRSGDRTIR